MSNVTGRICGHDVQFPAGEPPLVAQGCGTSKKIAYTTEASAQRALQLMVLRRQVQENSGRPKEHVETRYYRCNTCPGWHLTSKVYEPPPPRGGPA